MILAIILSLLVLASPAEVDNLNILLPELQKQPHTMPLQLISAQDGCYYWKTSQPDIISVTTHLPKPSGCSRQALVSVSQVGAYPSSIYVGADDSDSESGFKIPVRLRKLSKISIFTKSRMMNIKQIQKLELFAFDGDGNTFTSLEGMRFKWNLQQHYQIIELVPMRNAHLFLPLKTRENLEQSGYQSDMIIVRALAPGNIKVTATCVEPGYEHLSDQITISVHERFELQPGPLIRMAPETSLQLKLVRPTMQQIQVPQSYYRITGCTGFNVNSSLYLTVPDRPSRCTLKVEDTRTKPPYESSVEIFVQTADEIRIITSPLIIVDKESEYQIQLMKGGQSLYGESKKVILRSEFELNQGNKILVARKKITGTLSAQLGNLRKEVVITSLLPVRVVLPDDYLHLPVGENFKLKMLGGTGVYDFQISNQVATMSNINILHAKAVGDIAVTVRDRNHLANNAFFRLKVSEMTEIQSLQLQKEVNRDEWGFFYIIGRSSVHETYTQCHQNTFSLTVPTSSLEFDRKVNQPQTISFLHFHQSDLVQKAISPTSLLKGRFYQIVESYTRYVKEREIESGELKAYVLGLENFGVCRAIKFKSIVSFEEDATIVVDGEEGINIRIPLRIYDHVATTIENGDDSEFLMTPESSLRWTYSGGSYSWPNSITEVYVNNKKIEKTPLIKCQNKETVSETYKLQIKNNQTRRLLFPTSQIASLNIICKFPKKLHLKLEHGQAFDEIFIEPHREVRGQLQVSDQYNKLFYNCSNVQYEYNSKTGVLHSKNSDFSYRSNGINDTLTISTGKIVGGISFRKISLEVTISIVPPIQVMHPLQSKEKNLTILALYTPKKPYIITVKDLHSQVFIQCTKAVSCEKGENSIAVKLLKLGTGNVIIRDKKIYGSQAWNIEFIIVEMDEVRVNGDRDYVQEGQMIEIRLTNYYKGQLISPYTYESSYLQLMMNKNLRVVEQRINTFIVRAEKAGEYEIFGENTFPIVKRSEKSFNLNVYQKITPNLEEIRSVEDKGFLLMEARTAILVGCRRLIRVEGGPKDIILSHHSDSGQIKIAAVGTRNLEVSSSIEGQFSMIITVKFKENEIARIMVTLAVSKIESIELQSINEPVEGAQFRIHPKFRIGNSNLEESTCDFEYHWTVSNNNVRLGESMSFGFIDGSGINATALRHGYETVSLEVTSKQKKTVLGKASTILEILSEIHLSLPTYIDRASPCQLTSILMPPSTRYYFDSNVSVSAESGAVSLGEMKNMIESGRKLGHSTITLTKSGHRTLHVEVQVKQVESLYIGNTEGFISIEPNSIKRVPIYLQDHSGRVFVSPLQNLDITAVSSNNQLLKVELSPEKDSLDLTSKGTGVCVISLIMPNRNIIDSIVVSIGSALNPGRMVKILAGGKISYSTAVVHDKWTSSHPEIASVDTATGLVKAHKIGTTKITYGELSSTVEVSRVSKLIQAKAQRYVGSGLEIDYIVLWQGKNGLEEMPHLGLKGAVDNNLQPTCQAGSRYLTTKTEIINEKGFERIRCKVSAAENQNLPEKITVTIKDGSNSQLGQFTYTVKPHFTLEKREYLLSPSHSKQTLKIKTPSQLNITSRNAKHMWVDSSYNQDAGLQTVQIDMSSTEGDVTWWLELACEGQREELKVVFSKDNKGKEHSFWSFNLDWPDYLIMMMGLVFITICIIQYFNEQKQKSQ